MTPMDMFRMPVSVDHMIVYDLLSEDTRIILLNVSVPQADIIALTEENKLQYLEFLKDQVYTTTNYLVENQFDNDIEDVIVGFILDAECNNFDVIKQAEFEIYFSDIFQEAYEYYADNGFMEVKDIIIDGNMIRQAFIWDKTRAGDKLISTERGRSEYLNNEMDEVLRRMFKILENGGIEDEIND